MPDALLSCATASAQVAFSTFSETAGFSARQGAPSASSAANAPSRGAIPDRRGPTWRWVDMRRILGLRTVPDPCRRGRQRHPAERGRSGLLTGGDGNRHLVVLP